MQGVMAIFRREMGSYFVTPVAYIVLAIFYVISGLVFWENVSGTMQANLTGTLGLLAFVLLFSTPFLTMRLIAEEKRGGTLELLLTSPVTPFQIVLGKYLAALALVLLIIGGTLLYAILLLFFSPMEAGPLIAAYLGLILFAAALVGIGVATSALADNQIAAGLIGFGVSFLLYLVFALAGSGKGVVADVLREFAPLTHYMDFQSGVIDLKHVLYFFLWIVLCLSISTKSLEAKLNQ